jgi:hypothetical protein
MSSFRHLAVSDRYLFRLPACANRWLTGSKACPAMSSTTILPPENCRHVTPSRGKTRKDRCETRVIVETKESDVRTKLTRAWGDSLVLITHQDQQPAYRMLRRLPDYTPRPLLVFGCAPRRRPISCMVGALPERDWMRSIDVNTNSNSRPERTRLATAVNATTTKQVFRQH